jgi:choline dehydrogenase-like flavoprotein
MDQELSQVENKIWDNVIIGTGMGAAALGYALAKAGQSVLFCEKGSQREEENKSDLAGFAEKNLNNPFNFELRKEIFNKMGRFVDPLFETSDISKKSKITKLFPMLGAGVGGSSAIYGMVLERFFPYDFENNDWPIRFSSLEPFYQQAESLFAVHGQQDPLKLDQSFSYINRTYQEVHPVNNVLIKYLRENNYHPYLLPLANKRINNCNTCQGYLCNQNCKNDAWNTLIQPALMYPFSKLLTRTEVISLVANSDQIQSAIMQMDNRMLKIKGKRFILGAGAINTPKILLQSKSLHHPDGIGNHFSVVGKFLMRHLVDLYALNLKGSYGQTGSVKEFGFNDFYSFNNYKFGNIQSFGALPAEDLIANDLLFKLMQNKKTLNSISVQTFLPIVKKIIKYITQPSTLLAATMEDEPCAENSIYLNERNEPYLKYRISSSDQEKLKVFRSHILKLFKPFNPRIIKMAESNEMLGHICGTCRMGNDPRKSVVDQYNKVHGIKNLYVVDSSFLPASGGTNPALTLVANSLRVADHLIKSQ